MGILIGFLIVIGILLGMYLSLLIQGVALVATLWYFNSSSYKRKELDGLFDVVFAVYIWIGIALGNISYAVQTTDWANLTISNPFILG